MSYHFSKTKRFILFLIGQIVVGFGIAFTTHPGLGTSPLTSFSYVTTFKIPWTFGTANIVIGFAFVLAQYIILKSRFGWKHIAQIPILFLFGILVDVCMWLTKSYIPEAYFLRVTEVVLGCILLAVGVGFQLIANIALMPADGLIRVMSEEYRISYGILKICFDSTNVILAILFSLFCFHNITGVREGTLISAFLVGFFIRLRQNTMRKVKFLLLK